MAGPEEVAVPTINEMVFSMRAHRKVYHFVFFLAVFASGVWGLALGPNLLTRVLGVGGIYYGSEASESVGVGPKKPAL